MTLPLAVVELVTTPDAGAFVGGVVLGLTVLFLVVVGIGGLLIVRRILGA